MVRLIVIINNNNFLDLTNQYHKILLLRNKKNIYNRNVKKIINNILFFLCILKKSLSFCLNCFNQWGIEIEDLECYKYKGVGTMSELIWFHCCSRKKSVIVVYRRCLSPFAFFHILFLLDQEILLHLLHCITLLTRCVCHPLSLLIVLLCIPHSQVPTHNNKGKESVHFVSSLVFHTIIIYYFPLIVTVLGLSP